MTNSFNWKRIWYPADARAPLTDGYLSDAKSWRDPETPSGISLSSLRNVPCVVLLGTPGMGKTTEVRRAAAEAETRGQAVTVVSLSSISTPDELSNSLREARDAEWQKIDAKGWDIFLDGLDEIPVDLAEIQRAIPQILRQIGDERTFEKLRFRISCRTAQWPLSLEAELKALWNEEEVAIVQLERLREDDVRAAADQYLGAEAAKRFLEQVEKYDAEPLASRPVTLNMLLNIFQQESEFPLTQQELYRRGLLAFIEEGNALRRKNPQTWRLDTTSKLMVAGRIATALVLSDHSELWAGLYSELPARSLSIADIAGGYEPTLGASFPVGETELREVLLSSLFMPRGREHFVFAHKTFAEFLAAHYLTQHALNTDQLFALLCTSEIPDTIPPQLREVAAWLAGINPDFFRKLATSQPDILLVSDVASSSNESKELLVRQLMSAFEQETITDFDYSIRRRYGRLRHPTLANQLNPYIASRTMGVIARRVAIDIAQEANLRELIPLLLDVALDRTDNPHIRAQATSAIAEMNVPDAIRRLVPLAISEIPEDENDDIKGWALRATYPNYVSAKQVIAALTPEKQSNRIGAYHMFLTQMELIGVKENDASEILGWAANQIRDEELSPFNRVIPRFLEQLWNLSRSEVVLDAFVEFFRTVGKSHKYLSLGTYFNKFISVVRLSKSRRRSLIIKLLSGLTPQDLNSNFSINPFSSHSLLSEDDLAWLLDQFSSGRSPISNETLISLIVSKTHSEDINSLVNVWDAAESSPALYDALRDAYSISLSSSNARLLRDDHLRSKKALSARSSAAQQPFDAIEYLLRGLERIEQGDPAYWWQLNLIFFVKPDRNIDFDSELKGDLTSLPLWASIAEQDRRRLLRAASRYICEYRPRSRWLGQNQFNRSAAAGYRAFHLLQKLSPDLLRELRDKDWAKWAPSLIAPIFNFDEAERSQQRELVSMCFQRAPKQVFRVLDRLLRDDATGYAASSVTSLFNANFTVELGAFLFNIVENTSHRQPNRDKVIIRFLLRNSQPDCLRRAEEAVVSAPPAIAESEYVIFLTALLEENSALAWRSFFALTKSNNVLAKTVIHELAETERLSREASSQSFSDFNLAELLLWLFKEFPEEKKNPSGRSRYVSEFDHIDHFRSSLLRTLVSRGTASSVAAVAKLVSSVPERPWLKYQLLDAQRAMAANTWKRRNPAEIIAYISFLSPPLNVKSTKAQIVEGTQAFQSANTEITLQAPRDGESYPEVVEGVQLGKGPIANELPIRLLAVATEWRSQHGGVSTLSRELCIAMAALGHEVACAVVHSSESEKADAARAGVTLIDAPNYPTLEDATRLLTLNKRSLNGFQPDVVIGHDHITGAAGLHLAKGVFEIPYVHFVHTVPESAEQHKTRNQVSLLYGSRKAEEQKRLCALSDLVVCIGPLLHRIVQTSLQAYSVPVVELRPGLNADLLKRKSDTTKIRASYCLLLARLEDGILKGADIACHVIAALNRNWRWGRHNSPKLIMRGFSEGTIDQDLAALGGIDHAKPHILVRGYTTDSNAIADDICMSSVMFMPSRIEGFGLVALEAIAAGTPVLITSSSGIGELLTILATEAHITVAQADACVVDVSEADLEKTIEEWSTKAQATVSNISSSFAAADELRQRLAPVLSWKNAARQLVSDIRGIL